MKSPFGTSIKAFFAVLLLAVAAGAQAGTDCTSTITRAYADANTSTPNFYVTTTAGTGFILAKTDVNYPTVVSIAMTAYAQQANVLMHFTANSVNCSTLWSFRTDLEYIALVP